MLTLLATTAIVLQAAIMIIDELYFHRRRSLPRWERIGHPLDTLTVLACYAVALLAPVTPLALRVFAALAAFSCLFVTKDEFVHSRECRPHEQWLHALLFLLHPIVLASVAWLWVRGIREMLVAQSALTGMFGLYQVLYWNTSWSKPAQTR
jgi:hypothetical protein